MRFLIREADFKDRKDLLELARCFPLCSLPADRFKLENKIQLSKESFKQNLSKVERSYLFVLEDRKSKKVIGSSQILSYFGEHRSLCYFLKTKGRKKFLQLGQIKTGRHQMGGLILHPDYRRSPENLGLQISAARFLYIKTFSKEFSELIEVSLTAPVHKNQNHFWSETGSKYLKMDYSSSLRIFQKNRLKFFSLFPKQLKLNLTRLSSGARKCLEQVHLQTLPVYRGLLKRGFCKTRHHHVLDGGIYLEALGKNISFLKKARGKLIKRNPLAKKTGSFLLSQQTKEGFFCTQTEGEIKKENLFIKSLPPGFEENKKIWILKVPF